ncbi:fatty acyl-AMP ligase [Actinosynnema sp. NPDC020468]|uniref:fatty acyl-AMP ligase n=1 Tax=Actinosynnema sp. NPDC020468 TaxID=3154488 RepID=UPI0033C7C28A
MWTVFRERLSEVPVNPAVTFTTDSDDSPTDVSLSYPELDLRSARTAAWLRGRLAPGDRALVLCPTAPEFATAFLGCLRAGVVAVPVPPPGRFRHERRRVTGIARDAGVRALLTDVATGPAVAAWAAEEGVSAPRHEVDGPGPEPGSDRLADVPALLQYTSGSTGRPKGVVVTQANLLSNVDAIVAAHGMGRHDRFGGWIPLHHDMGLIGLLLPGILRGAGYVQLSPVAFLRRPHRWLRLLDRYDLHASASPDFGFDLCARRVTDEQLTDLDLSRVRGVVNGAEPVRASTVERFTARFAPAGFRAEAMVPSYGLAEATLMATCTPGRPPRRVPFDPAALERGELRPADGSRELVGCGARRSGELLIVDPTSGAEREPGRIGEIWLRGPGVAAGYWRDEVATAAVFGAHTVDGRGPYLRTGDLGGVLDGDLFVTGRRKDVLVLRGRTLHPQDVEDELREAHPELAGLHGAVFAVDGVADLVVVHEIRGHWGAERFAAVAAGIRHTVSREFGVVAGVVALVRPGAVLRTTSGKVERAATRAGYLADELDTLLHSAAVPR